MCSFQVSYPRVWRKRQESNLRLQVISLVLSMSYILILRLAEHGHASRTAPVRCESLNTRPCEGGRASKGKARRKNGRAKFLPGINEANGESRATNSAMFAARRDCAMAYSAGAATCARSFSAPCTSTAIAAVPITKPSAMMAATPSTRSKPPRPCSSAISDTAAPDTTNVRK